MKIAILEPYIEGIGGAQKVIARYASFLNSKGHDIEIFTQRYNKDTTYPEFKEIKINILKPRSKFLSPLTFFMYNFGDFDVIIANDWPSNFTSLRHNNVIWVCYTPKRDFYDLKDYYFKRANFKGKVALLFKKFLFKYLDFLSAQKANKITVASNNNVNRVKKYYSRNDVKLIYHGIDINDYQIGKYQDYLLYVSRLVKPKRVDLAIKAMKFIKNKKLKLYIIGDGEEKDNLLNLIRKDKIDNVEFLGKVNNNRLQKLYSNCLAVIYTPLNEDWGLIPLEAGASGKATIGVNEGGLKETIVNNKTGFLIPSIELSPKKIAEKIDYLFNNKSIAKKMGLEARKKAEDFDWKPLLEDFEKLVFQVYRNNKHKK